MRYLTLLAIMALTILGCKEQKEEVTPDDITTFEETAVETSVIYPDALAKVLEVHGGLEQWSGMNSLTFSLEKGDGVETHTVHLKDRRTRIDGQGWSIGSDDGAVWLDQEADGLFEGNARFYHNLYFYFYAMPFVLADEGIRYSEAEPMEIDGVSYPGIRISYMDGVGDSSKDEYILYFDPESYVMKWLAYTVTYSSGESSEDWRYIKYSKWSPINGLTLPASLTWYQMEEGKPTVPRNELVFSNVNITADSPGEEFFDKPSSAVVVDR